MADIIVEEGELYDEVPANEVVVPKGRYVAMVAPTEELEDGTIEISDWVRGVKLVDYSYDATGNKAIFTLGANQLVDKKDAPGEKEEVLATARKYFRSPHHRSDIVAMAQDDPRRKERIQWSYNDVLSFFKSFIYPKDVDAVFNSLEKRNLRIVCDALWAKFKDGKNNTNGDVWLKLHFKNDTGIKPEFVIPDSRFYLGSERFEPKWITNLEGDKARNNDKKNFAPVPADPDFADPSENTNEFADQAADVNETFGSATPELQDDSLATPDVDLLT